jgi:mannose-1-phosphate guanylyltransferase
MHEHIAAIAAAAGSERFDETFEREFTAIRGKSIDFAVLEHYENVVVIEATFDWDDLGSWRSLERLYGADESGNTVIGAIWASAPPGRSSAAATGIWWRRWA